MTLYRAAHIKRHGFAQTLRKCWRRKATRRRWRAARGPHLTPRNSPAREAIAPHLDAKDQPTLMACLFGDKVADSLGYKPLGLSERAGLMLPLCDARLDVGQRTGGKV